MPSWGYFIDMFLYYPKGQKLEALELNMPKRRANTLGFSTLIKLFLILSEHPLYIYVHPSRRLMFDIIHHHVPPWSHATPLQHGENWVFWLHQTRWRRYVPPSNWFERPRWYPASLGFSPIPPNLQHLQPNWEWGGSFGGKRSGEKNCKIWEDLEHSSRVLKRLDWSFSKLFFRVAINMATPLWSDNIHSSWLPGILAGAETEVKTSNFGSPKPKKKKLTEFRWEDI